MIYAIFFSVWVTVFLFRFVRFNSNTDLKNEDVIINSPFYQKIYNLSFSVPFKWFVEDDRNLTPKGIKTKEMLAQAGYDKKFTVRSYMAYKVIVMFASLLLTALTILVLNYLPWLEQTFFNALEVSITTYDLTTDKILLITCFYLFLGLFPGIRMKFKAKKEIVKSHRDLPIIHMFTILMLRSNKTVSEVLYSLSKLNTYHRAIFETGYRMYMRNPKDGFSYIKSHFTNKRFIEMFNLLEDISTCGREECILIMDSNMNALINDINTIKRRNDLSGLVYSQASMIAPFLSIILLGAAPILMAALRMFSQSVIM